MHQFTLHQDGTVKRYVFKKAPSIVIVLNDFNSLATVEIQRKGKKAITLLNSVDKYELESELMRLTKLAIAEIKKRRT